MRRFATGLDTPETNTNEGQRADSAPRGTLGDGVINSGDVVQTRRYATGLDPQTAVGGPLVSVSADGAEWAFVSDLYAFFFGQTLRVGSVGARRGETVTVPIEMTSSGDETAVGFTLEFDPSRLDLASISLGEAASAGSVMTVNDHFATSGRIGVLVDSSERSFAGGPVILATFYVANDLGAGIPIRLTDSIAKRSVSDEFGRPVAMRYVNGVVGRKGTGL